MKLGSLALKMIVAYLKHGDKKTRKDRPLNGDFEIKSDIDALGDGRFDHQIDIIYAPKDKRLGKTLIDIHGGAYIYSYRKNNVSFASVFASKGYDVVLLDYPHNGKKHNQRAIEYYPVALFLNTARTRFTDSVDITALGRIVLRKRVIAALSVFFVVIVKQHS